MLLSIPEYLLNKEMPRDSRNVIEIDPNNPWKDGPENGAYSLVVREFWKPIFSFKTDLENGIQVTLQIVDAEVS